MNTATDPMLGTCGHRDDILVEHGRERLCLMCARRKWGNLRRLARSLRRSRREAEAA